MTSAQDVTVTDLSTAERLSEALAEVFRTAEVGDVLTDDVFLDGNPPLWRFQLQGIEAFAAWYKSYAPNGMDEVNVVRTVPTASGFVTELTERNREDTGKEITGREIVLCTVRDGRISELMREGLDLLLPHPRVLPAVPGAGRPSAGERPRRPVPDHSGAVQAISHICIQGAIQSVAEGTRVRRRAVRLRRVT